MCIAIYLALIALLLFYTDFVIEQYSLASIAGEDSVPMVVAVGWEMITLLWPVIALAVLVGSAVTALVLRRGRNCTDGACTS